MSQPVQKQSLFFTFEDSRKNGKGHLVELSTKNVYNHVSNWTDCDQRWHFTGLFFSQALTGCIVRIPFRLYDIFSGDTIRRGIANAQHEFRILKVEKNGKVSKLAYALLLAKNILLCLAKDIMKLVTYPLAMIALQFAAILGVSSPLDAWVIYGKIEDFWRPDNSLQKYKAAHECKNLMLMYSAPCMQTQEAYRQNNLYPILGGDYSETDLRTLRMRLSRELERFSIYFGAAYQYLQKRVEELKFTVDYIVKQNKIVPEKLPDPIGTRQKKIDMSHTLYTLLYLFDKVLETKDDSLNNAQIPDSSPTFVAKMIETIG